MTYVIDANQITDEMTLHQIFSDTFGFPDYYGMNWNAWIDVMYELPHTSSRMPKEDQIITLHIKNATSWKKRTPEVFNTFIECLNEVNIQRYKWSKIALILE